MRSSFSTLQRIAAGAAFLAGGTMWFAAAWGADAGEDDGKSLAQQIFEAMAQDPGAKPGYRVAHAKGIVCEGTFVPSAGAGALSQAADFPGGAPPGAGPCFGGAPHPLLAGNCNKTPRRGRGGRASPPAAGA